MILSYTFSETDLLVKVSVRGSTYALDGLLYCESDLQLEKHYTDTAGFTDHVFALTRLAAYPEVGDHDA
nr:Tn3 family transposase [Variovorax sp. PAMC26660]